VAADDRSHGHWGLGDGLLLKFSKFEYEPTFNPAWELKMRKLNVSVLIIASAALAVISGQAMALDGPRHAPFEHLCSERGGPSHHPELAKRLAEHLDLNDAQKAAFKEFHDARRKSLEDAKTALCTSKSDLSSFETRLVFGQTFLEARLTALKAENPKLIAFYNSLDARQKQKFDRFRVRQGLE
jgi:Spy/CpxP family protein refolding chaperone